MVQPLALLYPIFDIKGNPFVHHLNPIDECCTFHIPSLELCVPFSGCCNCICLLTRAAETH